MPKHEQRKLFTPAPLPVAPLNDAQRLACLRLIRSSNVGPVTFRDLINHYGGAELALEALPELSRRGGRAIRICPRERAESELAAAAKIGAHCVFTIEPGYPALLAHVEVPPPLLYLKGDTAFLRRPAIAIVGSRLASAAGLTLARQFARDLGRAGLVTVSGLARGIDAAVHQASLATGTVAVLAGGLDFVYPPEHATLQASISERGCLISEMPPGFQPRAKEFPRRNRLISGISYGVLVIEAARRSGTLVTARMAAEQGRDVFAVPGHPLDPRAEGTNQLLKTGATMVTSAADVLEILEPVLRNGGNIAEDALAYDPRPPEQTKPPPLLSGTDRQHVLSVLGPQPSAIDDIARATGLGIRDVRIIVMELDLAGRIERHGQTLVSLRTGDDLVETAS